jgi:hypothetical protein
LVTPRKFDGSKRDGGDLRGSVRASWNELSARGRKVFFELMTPTASRDGNDNVAFSDITPSNSDSGGGGGGTGEGFDASPRAAPSSPRVPETPMPTTPGSSARRLPHLVHAALQSRRATVAAHRDGGGGGLGATPEGIVLARLAARKMRGGGESGGGSRILDGVGGSDAVDNDEIGSGGGLGASGGLGGARASRGRFAAMRVSFGSASSLTRAAAGMSSAEQECRASSQIDVVVQAMMTSELGELEDDEGAENGRGASDGGGGATAAARRAQFVRRRVMLRAASALAHEGDAESAAELREAARNLATTAAEAADAGRDGAGFGDTKNTPVPAALAPLLTAHQQQPHPPCSQPQPPALQPHPPRRGTTPPQHAANANSSFGPRHRRHIEVRSWNTFLSLDSSHCRPQGTPSFVVHFQYHVPEASCRTRAWPLGFVQAD